MSGSRRAAGLMAWLDERYGIADLIDFAKKKEVPLGKHSIFWYYLGGTTLFFFMIQVVSGLLLLMYYQPGADTSYESVRFIATKVPFGWLVRSVHCWSAHLMILSLVVHMFSTLALNAYRKPRELTWVTGCVLLGLAMGFGFSGYLLPWNELAFFATAVGTDSLKSVPLVGQWLLEVMRGGEDVTINTVYRFFALHVAALPLVAAGLIAVHLMFVQRQGMAPPVGLEHAPRGMKFFPNFAMRDAMLWMICLILLATLAVFLPYGPGIPGVDWELGNKADPLAPAYPGIKPEWYFLWVYQLLKEFPPHIFGMEGPQVCLLIVAILGAVWVAVPWLDRRSARNQPGSLASDFGVAAILFLTFLTLKAWDIGGGGTAERLPDPVSAAWVCAWWTLGLAAVITVVRWFAFSSRGFVLSGSVALQVVLHGLAGMSYLAAGAIALVAAAVMLLVWLRRKAAAVLVLLVSLGVSVSARAGEDESKKGDETPTATRLEMSEELRKLFAAKDAAGKAILSGEDREYFTKLPAHVRQLLASAIEADLVSSAAQVRELLSLRLSSEKFELLAKDKCILCHTDPETQDAERLFSTDPKAAGSPDHLNLKEMVSDVHFKRGLSCAGCHGGDPNDDEMYDDYNWPEDHADNPAWVPGFCGGCHSDSEFMRGFNPALPTDQLVKYQLSHHGKLLLGEGDAKAPHCVSCHGNHGIRAASSPLSSVHPRQIENTCGSCHADDAYMQGYLLSDGSQIPTTQVAEYRRSIHGQALARGNLAAPACNDCHGNHASMPPAVAGVTQICRTCHVVNGQLFDGSTHKGAFEQHGWPECGSCHGQHAISKTSDAMLGNVPGTVCIECHLEYSRDNLKCSETAEHFRSVLTALVRDIEELDGQVAHLATRGLDEGPLEGAVAEGNEVITKARSQIHSFDRRHFDLVALVGHQAVERGRKHIASSEEAYRGRRRGLVLAILAMALVTLVLWLKLREIERG